MSYRSRIETLSALVMSVRPMTSDPIQGPICIQVRKEFQRVYQVYGLRQRDNSWILQVLYSTRALDSYLKGFRDRFGYPIKGEALGNYLTSLTQMPTSGHACLTEKEKTRYQNRIVRKRNRYMHTAGAFPAGNQEIETFLHDMHDCLARVATL